MHEQHKKEQQLLVNRKTCFILLFSFNSEKLTLFAQQIYKFFSFNSEKVIFFPQQIYKFFSFNSEKVIFFSQQIYKIFSFNSKKVIFFSQQIYKFFSFNSEKVILFNKKKKYFALFEILVLKFFLVQHGLIFVIAIYQVLVVFSEVHIY